MKMNVYRSARLLFCGIVLFSIADMFAWEIKNTQSPSKAELTAAAELKLYLGKTVKEFKLAGKNLGTIYLGDSALARSNGIETKKLPSEKWIIKSVGNDLIITGGEPRGIIYATYKFLEDVIGVRFFSTEHEYVPAAANYSFNKLDLSGKPYMTWRCIHKGGEYPYAKDGGRTFAQRLLNDYSLQGKNDPLRYGGQLVYRPRQLHNFFVFMPVRKYFKTNPEFYALRNGKRVASQLCLTNPEMRKEFLKNLKALIARENAIALKRGTEKPLIYNVAQNDSADKCLCTKCMEFEKKHNNSGLLLDFLNELSREIRKIDPALQIRTYAYLQSVNAPKGIKAENNIIVILCNTHGTNHLTGESSKFSRLLKAWSNAVSLLHVHEYEILFQAYPESPWASEFSFPKIFKEWAANKVVGANIEQEDYFGSDMADMKFYLMAKFMEDPYRKDFDRLMEDFCDKYYGPAGKEVLQYRRTLKKLSDKAETRISWMCSKAAGHNRYITLNDMLALQKLFDQAEKKVKDSKIHTERLGRARLALDWLLGFELFRDYLRDWNKINPGKKFPLDLQAVRTRALQNFKRDIFKTKDSRFARFRYIMKENTEVSVSPEFKDIPHHDIAAFEISSRNLITDQDAESKAAVYEVNAKPSFGIYDVMSKRNFSGMTYPAFTKDRIKGPGYHWYKVISGKLQNKGAGCNLILTTSWSNTISLAYLSGIDYSKPVEIWCRFKVEGPAYDIPSKNGKNAVYIDRIVIRNIKDTATPLKEAAKACAKKQHKAAIEKYLNVAKDLTGKAQYNAVWKAGYCQTLHARNFKNALSFAKHITDPYYAKAYQIELLKWAPDSAKQTIALFAKEDISKWHKETQAGAYLRRGTAFFLTKNAAGAEADLLNAYKTGSSFTKWTACQMLGDVYANLKNDPVNAEKYYRECMKGFPGKFPAFQSECNLVKMMIRLKKTEEAIKLIDSSRSSGIYLADMLAEKAKICIAMGKKEMAEAALQKAVRQKMHHFQKKRFEKMLNDLQKK